MQSCPYCHSTHVQFIERSQQPSQVPSTTLSSFSPITLATIGSQMSKRIDVHPLIGGLVGLVIGGMVFLCVQHQNNITILSYRCEQCQEHFEIQQSS